MSNGGSGQSIGSEIKFGVDHHSMRRKPTGSTTPGTQTKHQIAAQHRPNAGRIESAYHPLSSLIVLSRKCRFSAAGTEGSGMWQSSDISTKNTWIPSIDHILPRMLSESDRCHQAFLDY